MTFQTITLAARTFRKTKRNNGKAVEIELKKMIQNASSIFFRFNRDKESSTFN